MIMPIDIDKKEFSRDKKGYNSREVDAYKKEMSAAAEHAAPLPPAGGFSPRSFGEVEPPQRFGSAAPVQTAEPLADSRASRNDSAAFRMVVIEPKSIDECRKLIDNLRANKPVIINLEKVETDLARKMFDFLSGATYALSGTIQRINQNIYLFAPRNVNIRALVDRATEAGKPTNTSPW